MENESLARAPSLAVLPFENLSGEDQYRYFSRGLTEELIVDLSHFSALQIISSYTSSRIADPDSDVIDAARKIEINYLLKGSLFLQPGCMRLNTQLLDTENRKVVWAERFEAPLDSIFDIHDSIVERVVYTISSEVDNCLLTAAREKPATSLAAYDCWLRGMDRLRCGTLADDHEAREFFNQALVIDPSYARAYAGLSLSYFNEWSCQLWNLWEISEKSAFNYAVKAFQLDEGDHLVQMILGRIYIYRRQFEEAEYHINRSLELNGNDADNLVQLATCMAFLGRALEGEELFRKALRLNPYRNLWYYQYGSLVYFVLREFATVTEMALKRQLVNVWVDLPGYIASAYAHLGEKTAALRYVSIFVESFIASIKGGEKPSEDEILEWIRLSNPFKNKEDMECIIEGLVLAGLKHALADHKAGRQEIELVDMTKARAIFKQEQAVWHMQFDHVEITMPDLKGFHDIARLLASAESGVHCTELMGAESSMDEKDFTMDDKARREYEEHVLELQRSLDEAEEYNDIGRKEKLQEELEYILAHLSKNF
ncbi:MAG TPA: hypothetical protein VJ969_09970, partial [Desulfopila sp.]|nr:hypothetical protein [Desulfopila sp.]